MQTPEAGLMGGKGMLRPKELSVAQILPHQGWKGHQRPSPPPSRGRWEDRGSDRLLRAAQPARGRAWGSPRPSIPQANPLSILPPPNIIHLEMLAPTLQNRKLLVLSPHVSNLFSVFTLAGNRAGNTPHSVFK